MSLTGGWRGGSSLGLRSPEIAGAAPALVAVVQLIAAGAARWRVDGATVGSALVQRLRTGVLDPSFVTLCAARWTAPSFPSRGPRPLDESTEETCSQWVLDQMPSGSKSFTNGRTEKNSEGVPEVPLPLRTSARERLPKGSTRASFEEIGAALAGR